MYGVGFLNNMVLNICWACNQEFEAARKSRLCCSIECRKLYQAQYDHDRYIEYRNADRKKKREMLIERYSISSTNLYKLQHICEECEMSFYYDYSIYESFNNTFVSTFNTTAWGVPCCPKCGLVEESSLDEIYIPSTNMNEVERKLFLTNLHRCKQPAITREAIYLKNIIDFIAEAETIRKMLNRIYNKGNLTQNQINECISILFRKIKEFK